MKAEATPLLTFIETSKQFVIPIYQRTYSWTQEECRQLWDDIIRTGENDKVKAHFIGSVMYVSDDVYQVSGHNPLLVIDGQQRLTSVTLLLAALERKLEALPVDQQTPREGFSPEEIRENYLTNRHGKDERRFRLILSAADKDTLLAIIGKAPELPPNHSHRINDNFELFATWIDERKGDLAPLCLGLRKLLMVDVALTRGQDNPQLIFESMNSTGKELTQADLIRNYVLMGLDHELQSQLYKDHWRPMELAFGQKAYGDSFDRFVRDYLTLKTREVPNINRVYDAFKAYFRESEFADQGIGSLVADIHRYATYYCRMSLIAEPDPGLRMAFQDLKEVEVEVAFPFLLEAYADYAGERLSKSDFLQIVRLVESYVFRRSVCEIPTNSMNKTFAGLGKLIDKTRYLESTQARFLLMTSQRSFPRDDDFHREIRTRDLYNNRRKRYWLRRLENHGRKEPISVHDYQVEHIMPQTLTEEWRAALGPEFERIYTTYLHTLGNLTYTGYNQEFSNRPFLEKRDMEGGFKESPLKLNAKLGQLDAWNEATIIERAKRLADKAVTVWPAPSIPETKLDEYRAKPKSGWTLEDHPQLGGGPAGTLFEALRVKIMALDEAMTEEVLKYYIAYRADATIAVIRPMAKQLRIELSIPAKDLADPKQLCSELSHTRVSCTFAKLAELADIMALVSQAYDYQLS